MTTIESAPDRLEQQISDHGGKRGWWIFLVSLLIQFSVDSSSMRDWFCAELQTPQFEYFAEPPMYFAHEDVVRGMSAASALLTILVFTGFTWSYSRLYSQLAQCFALAWTSSPIAIAVYVWFRCENLFTANAVCPWPTGESYLNDQWMHILSYTTLGVAFMFCMLVPLPMKHRYNAELAEG